MTLVAILALGLQDESAVRDALAFLVRHQAPDGSWGPRPDGCTCATAPAPPPPPVSIVDLQALWESDPAVVEAAQHRIAAAGVDALPRLRKEAEGIAPEVRVRHLEVIRQIERRREGCDIELTALAILAFAALGETGGAVQRGVQWLVSRQAEDGSFGGDDGDADVVAARAMIRWGHCGVPASRARRWLARNSLRMFGRLHWLRELDDWKIRRGDPSGFWKEPPVDLAALRSAQLRSGCAAGSWEGPGLRHALTTTAFAVMFLR